MDKKQIKDFVMKPILDAGFEVYFVGGCVRDAVLGKEPHDYDLATNATPSDLHKVFKQFSNVSDNAEIHGVTMPVITFGDGTKEEVEIATFRKDTSKGRKPTVSIDNVSIKEDAIRRDFTINALYEDIDGNIIDPTEKGMKDIKDKVIRFCGNAQDRIDEDPLRVLRLIRFVSKLGFTFVED